MAIEKITMPKLGESVTEGTISSWLVEPGQKVEKYDPLAEVLTDKVTAEIPSSYSGTIKEIIAGEDETLAVGEVICTIEVVVSESSSNEEVKEKKSIQEIPAMQSEKEEPQVLKVPTKNNQQSANGSRFSPAVLRIAAEKNIDLKEVKGSGKGGRVTRKDVLQFSNNTPISHPETKAGYVKSPLTETNSPKTSQGDREIPINGVRKAIAKHMVESKQTIPHAWMMVEADATELVRHRNTIKNSFKQQEGYSITYFAFFVKAVAQALKAFPALNSTWSDDKIIEHKDINISIAIAANDLLYVPVIKHADEKSIKGIAREISELAIKARNNQLTNADMSGGTFTVNSTGSFGSIQSMGIINHPQAAILQVESIVKRPVIVNDMIAIRDMVNLCLSIDHRILDGLMAGQFLQAIKKAVEEISKENTPIY